MTDFDKNLLVLEEHLHELAARQHTAADKVTGANRAVVDVADAVLTTHGFVCGLTSLALQSIDASRKAAGAALFKTSSELERKLAGAANNYNDADYRSSKSLGGSCEV